jgi:hypothetical protein
MTTDAPSARAAAPRLRRLGFLVSTVAVLAAGAMAFATARPAPPTDVGTAKPSANARYLVRLAPETSPVPLHALHRWTAHVARADGAGAGTATVAVDGGMPRHGHGLPTQPRVTGRLPDGRLVIDGVKFSMPGWWELRLRIDGPAGVDSVTFNLTL